MNRYKHTQSVELRASAIGEEKRTIEGYAVVFNRESAQLGVEEGKPVYEVIAPEAISRALLDQCTIALTLEHNFDRLLARSKQGAGTLSYEVDEHGVKFSAEMPNTAAGDEALEHVRRGNIDGCSFMFMCRYGDRDAVKRSVDSEKVVYTIRKITRVMDFTLTTMPAYGETDCAVRSEAYGEAKADAEAQPDPQAADQIAAMHSEIDSY